MTKNKFTIGALAIIIASAMLSSVSSAAISWWDSPRKGHPEEWGKANMKNCGSV